MENKVGDKYLPIGTVVKLFDGRAVLMITGYCIVPNGKILGIEGERENKEGTQFDYCACMYPAGIINTEVNTVFNHESIEKVLFMGFETQLQKQYSDFLKKEIEKMDKEKLDKEKEN